MSSPLFAAGPAQNELLIHFTGLWVPETLHTGADQVLHD